MEKSFFHRLSSTLWVCIVALMVLLAIYVSVGRLVMGNLGAYKTAILHELNYRVPFAIEAQQVSGEWHSFTPVIVLTGLRLSAPGSSDVPLQLSEGRVGVDVLNSLRTGSLQMRRVALNDLSLMGEVSSEGKLRFTGFGSGGGEIGKWLQEFLLNVELIALRNNLLKLTLPSGEVRDLDLNLLLSRDGSRRRVEAGLVSTRGTRISVLADGVGDPLRPEVFAGEVYVDIQTPDLGAIKELLPEKFQPYWADGTVDLELWLAWNKGAPSIEARLEARDLLIASKDSSLQVPLERVALQAQLLERKNHWAIYASDFEVTNDGAVFTLPRVQLDVWGGALRLRAADVKLDPLNDLVKNIEALPRTLRNVAAALRPRGYLTSLQLSLGDIEQPRTDWELEANFEQLYVDSYKGAPGVTSASGYTRLAPDGGFVILDSQNLSMDFPGLYSRPLDFDELYGTLNLNWDSQWFGISSGLVTARGEEGMAKVVFGLDIPLVESDVGIEMDLLVGLEDSRAMYREKYLPYVLSPALLNWLSDSIGEGRIEEGAFVWRGSLKKDIAHAKTIQLAINLVDTRLSYHPQWPPVTVDRGVVYIDDSAVSVWAEQARLFDLKVEHLSVETRLDNKKHIILTVDGGLVGPAADGLRVLNDSPLTHIVGNAFGDWEMSGFLETDLKLQLNLTDSSVSPWVEVATRWQDVDLTIEPGNLSIQGVNGGFDYSTERGFSARSLVAELWEEPLSVSLSQHHPSGAYEAGSSVVDIALASEVDMADVRRWLQLQPLAFVSGEAAADVGLRIAPGEPVLLTVNSTLEGVALDLPSPWKKPAEEVAGFFLEMPLAAGGAPLSLSLGEELNLLLDVREGSLRGGGLGINVPPAPLAAGIFHVTGQAPLVQGDEWIGFVSNYLVESGPESQSRVVATPSVAPASVESGAPALDFVSAAAPAWPLQVVVDDLRSDQLVIMGQQLQDVVFSLALDETVWEMSAATDWAQGDLSLARDGGASQLTFQRLDLSGLPAITGSGSGEESTLDLPVMHVSLENILQAEQRLGALEFELHSAGGVLTADHITGELARLSFSEEAPGRLLWDQGLEGHTKVKAEVSFQDLGQTLQYFGYERIVETGKGSLDFDLRWPGAPQNASLLQAQGAIQVNIGSGSFLEAPSGAAGALRVVSILNLADIVRRLSLSHMFESGIPFESVEGDLYLHQGTIEVTRMDVKGSSSFQFSGVSDVEAQSLSGELVATLPVARNLPWIAALAASLPVAAGVFIVSKVFDKQMNRLSSAVYSIEGSWNDPQVRFDRIFDNTSSVKSPKAAEPSVPPASIQPLSP